MKIASRKEEMKMKKLKGITVIQAIVAIVIVAILLIIPIAERASETTVTFTVEDKAIKRYDEDDKYLVYTDNGTYEITDSLVYLRWDSSDLYGKIKVGETYEAKVYGWRIPIVSSYKNIVSVTEVNE